MKFYLYILILSIILTASAGAVLAEPVWDANVQADLVSDVSTIQPGQSFWVGVHLDMDDIWQTYWKNPGDSGLATSVKWDLPEGFEAGDIHWPYPVRLDYPEVTSYGYEDQVMLLSEITPPAELPSGSSYEIKVSVSWLSCGKMCVPGKADLNMMLTSTDAAAEVDNQIREKFVATRLQWPLENSDWTIGIYDQQDSYRILIIPPAGYASDLGDVSFFPERDDVIDHMAEQQFSKNSNGSYDLTVIKSPFFNHNLTQLKGVLVAQGDFVEGRRALAFDEPVNFEM